jgi:hypothetical protein
MAGSGLVFEPAERPQSLRFLLGQHCQLGTPKSWGELTGSFYTLTLKKQTFAVRLVDDNNVHFSQLWRFRLT